MAYVQWGENYSPVDERQHAFAHALATAGYDLVIGLHPHVVQPVEIVSGVPVIYSLGNYVFTTAGRFNDAVPGFGLTVTTEFRPGRLTLTMRCIQTDNRARALPAPPVRRHPGAAGARCPAPTGARAG